jgi:hypothetical protein
VHVYSEHKSVAMLESCAVPGSLACVPRAAAKGGSFIEGGTRIARTGD